MTRCSGPRNGEPLGAPLSPDPRSAWQTVDTDALARHAVTSRRGEGIDGLGSPPTRRRGQVRAEGDRWPDAEFSNTCSVPLSGHP